ncbi:MAG TPA: uroporphyrinogen-III synthase [Terriglobales bacterium]|nr:uroporphyrinogen-III synthase [Terriglobales bacterium]
MSMQEQPLAGVRVLVGRARQQLSQLTEQLKKQGAEVIEIPFIEIRPPGSYAALDSAIRHIAHYDWLVLTSVNGVEALASRLKHLRIPLDQFAELQIAAIGPATGQAIERLGLEVSVVPREYVAEAVVESMRTKVRGKHVLLLRAKVARDVIPREFQQLGATVDVIEAYETAVPASAREELLAVMSDPDSRPQVVTFTSSSTVRNFVALLGGRVRFAQIIPDGIQFASIGPVTSATLREFGLSVHIEAAEYTIPGLVRAITKRSIQSGS